MPQDVSHPLHLITLVEADVACMLVQLRRSQVLQGKNIFRFFFFYNFLEFLAALNYFPRI